MAHLFVIAGHGAGDPGACANGFSEAERVRALATRIKALGGDQVTLGDFNRDYYADNGISNLDIPADWQITELHMDSAAVGAKGGHVIIKAGFTPDQYDNALASFIGGILPGRSNLIVGRDDLANPNRASARGFGYRLVEVGFITNMGDLTIFNNQMDDIARGILEAFGIKTQQTTPKSLKVVMREQTGGADQRWYIENAGDDCVYLKNKKTGLYLDVPNAKAQNDTVLQAYVGNRSDAQKWKIVKKSHGEADYTLLVPMLAPGKYASVEENGKNGKEKLKLWDDLKNSKQKFWMKQADDGSYVFVHTYSLMAITVV